MKAKIQDEDPRTSLKLLQRGASDPLATIPNLVENGTAVSVTLVPFAC